MVAFEAMTAHRPIQETTMIIQMNPLLTESCRIRGFIARIRPDGVYLNQPDGG